jgi:uncharacterized protein DUF4145
MSETFQNSLDKLADSLVLQNDGVREDSGLAARCPHCGVLGVFPKLSRNSLVAQQCVAIGSSRIKKNENRIIHEYCQSSDCGKDVLIRHEVFNSDGPEIKPNLTLLWPVEVRPSKAPASLKDDARLDYDEARLVLPYSAAAAATLARRCLQHVLRSELGIKNGRLFEEIGIAVRSDELTKPTRDALDVVRQIGNWGAHPMNDQSNTLIRVTSEEAEYTIEILEMLFIDLYEQPEKAKAMSKRLELRKKGGDSG